MMERSRPFDGGKMEYKGDVDFAAVDFLDEAFIEDMLLTISSLVAVLDVMTTELTHASSVGLDVCLIRLVIKLLYVSQVIDLRFLDGGILDKAIADNYVKIAVREAKI